MRLQSLLALAAASALLLPLGAHAGKLPAGYQANCVAQAQQQGVAKTAAEQHCTCAGKVIEKEFSDAEIKDLDSRDGIDASTMKRAQEKVAAACAPKK
ncbi:hypothetical protein D3C77_06910 [compost metagenome]|uniref:hypothetical protein n=1 Tax=Pseudomonas TaxID=286 RepID=UPI0003FD0FBF|nr:MULTISPECIES: hypothetical protein [Pseudomonas]MCW2270860.1 hypothetical protein [Pseudomonas sp. JUb96]PRA65928.1 hypothetical protein CQ065_11480 [Pseudomonas sp. MYb187]